MWLWDVDPKSSRLGITKQVSFHTLRQAFGTLLNANGENLAGVNSPSIQLALTGYLANSR